MSLRGIEDVLEADLQTLKDIHQVNLLITYNNVIFAHFFFAFNKFIIISLFLFSQC